MIAFWGFALQAARAFLHYLRIFEQTLCFLAFLVMAGALMGDVLRREFTGSGWFGAPQVGVVGMIVVAYMGISLASANGSHFRPKFADVVLRRWDSLANRIGEFGFAAFCYFMAYIAFDVAVESYELDDVSAVLRWPIWPVQGVIVMGFGLVAIRHTLYGIFIDLRPVPPEAVEGVETATDAGAENIANSQQNFQKEKLR
ncbi:MAG: TRAP transporter small permease [Rhodospirillaceae bacterium]|nr:TRAP transporter small permease [Rhodospirillaceae bacterium]